MHAQVACEHDCRPLTAVSSTAPSPLPRPAGAAGEASPLLWHRASSPPRARPAAAAAEVGPAAATTAAAAAAASAVRALGELLAMEQLSSDSASACCSS